MNKKTTRLIVVVLVIMTVMLACIPVFAVTGIGANTTAVTSKEARLREKKDKKSTCLATLSAGEQVTILTTTTQKNGWYKVKYTKSGKSIVGYIREDFIKKYTPSATPKPTATPTPAPAYASRYGNKTYNASDNLPRSEYVVDLQTDLALWALTTKNKNKPNKTIYETNGCFRVMTTDGYYGYYTADCVKVFQKYYGLVDDGIAGKKTLTKLYSWYLNYNK